MTTEFAIPTLPEELSAPGITREAVEALSSFCEDGPWLREQRTAAWEAFERLPMPTTRDEHWRFTNLRALDIDAVVPFSHYGDPQGTLQRLGELLTDDDELAGRVLHSNGSTEESALPPADLLPDGVVMTSINRAQHEHPELLARHFGSVVPIGDSVDDVFVALQQATMGNGLFVYVPRGVRVELPLRADIVHSADGGTVNWRALIVLDEGAEATFVEEFSSTAPELAGFSNAVVELVAGPASNLHYVTVQNLAMPVMHFATHRVLAHRDAQVEWTAVGLGASLGKSRMEARLVGEGANVRLNGAYFLDGKQQLDYDTLQVHEVPNTSSDLSFRGAIADRGRAVWRGMIDVAAGAQGTDAYQENRNLLLSRGAHADSVPGLEIEANEVRCTHGSTTSQVDAEQLFYLQSRGLTREVAVREIVRGFFVPVLDRITVESVREQIRGAVWSRMDRAAKVAAAGGQ